MVIELAPYDPTDYLVDEETIAEYVLLARESDDPRILAKALDAVDRARQRSKSNTSETTENS